MEVTSQSENRTPHGKNWTSLSENRATNDQKMEEAEETPVSIKYRIVAGMPEPLKARIVQQFSRESMMQLARAEEAEANDLSKKLKRRSRSVEVVSSIYGSGSPPISPLGHAYVPWVSNVLTQGATGATHESNQLVSGWTCFRMLILAEDDVMTHYEQETIINIVREEKAEISFYNVAGGQIVLVCAKEDPHSTTSSVEGFVRAHNYLYYSPFSITRLVVTAEQAKSFIYSDEFQDIENEFECVCDVYLTDKSLSVLSDGDAIIQLFGNNVNKVVKKIAALLSQSPDDKSLVFKLKNNGSILSSKENSADRLLTPEAPRGYEARHSTRIPLSCVDRIIGENGANIDAVQRACLVTIILSSLPKRDEVFIKIHGTCHEDCEAAERMMEGYIKEKVFEFVRQDCYYESPRSGGDSDDCDSE